MGLYDNFELPTKRWAPPPPPQSDTETPVARRKLSLAGMAAGVRTPVVNNETGAAFVGPSPRTAAVPSREATPSLGEATSFAFPAVGQGLALAQSTRNALLPPQGQNGQTPGQIIAAGGYPQSAPLTAAAARGPVTPLAANAGGYGPGENPTPYRSPLVAGQQNGPQMGPSLYEGGSDNRFKANLAPGSSSGFDLASQNARQDAALAPGRAALEERMPGGPTTRDVGMYAGPGDASGTSMLEFQQSNALGRVGDGLVRDRRAALQRDTANLAAATGYGALIDRKRKTLDNQEAINSAATNNLTLAQSGEATGRTRNALALLPSEIALKGSQAQENLGRIPLLSAQAANQTAAANRTNALVPSEIAKYGAESEESRARGGLYGAQALAAGVDADTKSLLAPGAYEQQRQATKKGAIDLKAVQELDALRQGALSGDPKAEKKFAQYMKANAGKGDGSVTEEDIITAFVNDRKAQAANPNAGPPQSYAEFKASITGTQLPIAQNPRALAIQADVQAGKIKPDEAKRQLMALGYK